MNREYRCIACNCPIPEGQGVLFCSDKCRAETEASAKRQDKEQLWKRIEHYLKDDKWAVMDFSRASEKKGEEDVF